MAGEIIRDLKLAIAAEAVVIAALIAELLRRCIMKKTTVAKNERR